METALKTIHLNLDRKAGRFVLDIDGKLVRQNVCEFLHTLSFVMAQDIETYLLSTDSRYDTVKIPLTSAGASASLSLHEFVALRDIYEEQMFLLKLEDLLVKKGIRL